MCSIGRLMSFAQKWIFARTGFTFDVHFVRYTALVPCWYFYYQSCLNSLWHIFNKLRKTFLRDFGPWWHDSVTQLLHICHIHDENLPFYHIPVGFYRIEIWWLWRLFEFSVVALMFRKMGTLRSWSEGMDMVVTQYKLWCLNRLSWY